MAEYKLILPSMGEGIMEATVTGWLKEIGEFVEEDDSVLQIATDKVDSDVPSPVSGKLIQKLKNIDEICKVGEVYAILEVEGENSQETKQSEPQESAPESEVIQELEKPVTQSQKQEVVSTEGRFYSPLVRSICKEENISQQELDAIIGTGAANRVTKDDIFSYLKNRNSDKQETVITPQVQKPAQNYSQTEVTQNQKIQSISSGDEIIEMDRMRKLIASHMLDSKRISPHVTSFVETDVTNVVLWRNKNKNIFQKREGEKLTFMPVFIHAIVRAIQDFPMINISVEGDTIIKKKNINIGMATALPNGNLIVPVIKNADQLSLSGLAKAVNDLAARARNNQLKPDDIKGGTYTITNIGSFGNLMGTPIINQPEVAILAVGSIVKKPAVIETPQGDLLGIRHKMFLSHTYDHRVVDGALGGKFVKRVSDYLEQFDLDTEI